MVCVRIGQYVRRCTRQDIVGIKTDLKSLLGNRNIAMNTEEWRLCERMELRKNICMLHGTRGDALDENGFIPRLKHQSLYLTLLRATYLTRPFLAMRSARIQQCLPTSRRSGNHRPDNKRTRKAYLRENTSQLARSFGVVPKNSIRAPYRIKSYSSLQSGENMPDSMNPKSRR